MALRARRFGQRRGTLLAQLDARCQQLAENPATLGRVRDDLGVTLRSFAFKRYVVFFRYAGEVFEVVRVLHSARDLEMLLAEDVGDDKSSPGGTN